MNIPINKETNVKNLPALSSLRQSLSTALAECIDSNIHVSNEHIYTTVSCICESWGFCLYNIFPNPIHFNGLDIRKCILFVNISNIADEGQVPLSNPPSPFPPGVSTISVFFHFLVKWSYTHMRPRKDGGSFLCMFWSPRGLLLYILYTCPLNYQLQSSFWCAFESLSLYCLCSTVGNRPWCFSWSALMDT